MKKQIIMVLAAALVSTQSNATREDSGFSFEISVDAINEWCMKELPGMLTQKDTTSLGKCFGSALGAYFVGDLFTEMADDFDESVSKKKSSLRLSKSFMHTWATFLRAVGYTGKGYAFVALASIPVRFFYPALKASNDDLYRHYFTSITN